MWLSWGLCVTCCVRFAAQDGDRSRHWVYVPYDCYYHVYDREALYRCAAKTETEWIHAMGDSQEREFVAIFKNINGSREDATKFEDVRGWRRLGRLWCNECCGS
jgi:hypothetical protein